MTWWWTLLIPPCPYSHLRANKLTRRLVKLWIQRFLSKLMALLVLSTGLLWPHDPQARHASLILGDSVTGGASISGAQSHEYDIDDPQPNQYKGRAFTCCSPLIPSSHFCSAKRTARTLGVVDLKEIKFYSNKQLFKPMWPTCMLEYLVSKKMT